MKEIENVSVLTANERRDLIIAELKRKSRIRTLLRGLPVDDVKDIITRMKDVLVELENDYRKREEDEKSKRAEAERILNDMESCGVGLNLLSEVLMNKSDNESARYLKDGVTWTGQGRRPDVFKGLGQIDLERWRIRK